MYYVLKQMTTIKLTVTDMIVDFHPHRYYRGNLASVLVVMYVYCRACGSVIVGRDMQSKKDPLP